jgi:uncharacterized protein (DUF934 family)
MNASTPTEPLAIDSVLIFDLSGKRVVDILLPTQIIEPAKLIAADDGQSMTQKIQRIKDCATEDDVLGIKFDKFADGRSYSIAARLREAGYTGALHALGDINQELVFMLKRVGFTHFHLPDPGSCELARHILEPFAGYYQAAQDGSQAPWQQTA